MIKREAILHIPLSQYAFANTESNMTIRLRTARNNVERVVLWYGDRVPPSDPSHFIPVQMDKIMSAGLFDYFDATFETPFERVCYYFQLISEEEMLYHYAEQTEEIPPRESDDCYQYPYIRREELGWEPRWFQEAIVYNIFPDSFVSEKEEMNAAGEKMPWERGIQLESRLGGTINSIREKLGYIQELGFNCIYLNPIFTAGAYHKYDLLDYFHISPNLGTDEDFRHLVKEAHRRGMRIIIDGVFNHCSWYFSKFDDVVKNGAKSQYADWFYRLEHPVIRSEKRGEKPRYSCFAYSHKMPKWNTSNPDVRAYFMEVCRYWLKEFGIDGWRLDVANEVDREFWREFKRVSRASNPQSVLIGEVWESAETWLNGDMFDSTMNYSFRRICLDFFGQGKIGTEVFHDRVAKMLLRYRTSSLRVQLNLLDSHDVNRFLSDCQGDENRFKLAEVFLFTSPGIPCVFYGDELGMDGDTESALRGPMPWERAGLGYSDFFRRLIALRKQNPVLTYGKFRLVRKNEAGLYIFSRSDEEKELIICLNNSAEKFDISADLQGGELLMQEGCSEQILGGMGYAILRRDLDQGGE